MDTFEILKLIEPIGGKVYAYDEIPLSSKIEDETFLAIFNTAPITKDGHWILICIFNNKLGQENVVYYMDGLGVFPTLQNVVEFINLNVTGKLVCNKIQMQAETSNACGKFCILCMYHLVQGKSFDSFFEYFYSPDPDETNEKVEQIFESFLSAIKNQESSTSVPHSAAGISR